MKITTAKYSNTRGRPRQDHLLKPMAPKMSAALVSLTSRLAVLVGHTVLLVGGQLEPLLDRLSAEKEIALVLLDIGYLQVLQSLGQLGDCDVLPVAAVAPCQSCCSQGSNQKAPWRGGA